MEPKPFRPGGPQLRSGGIKISPFIVRRLAAHGNGFHPFGQPSRVETEPIRTALEATGRSFDEIEIVGGLRPIFTDPNRPADLEPALGAVAWQLQQGYTTLCFNPADGGHVILPNGGHQNSPVAAAISPHGRPLFSPPMLS